MKSNEIAFSEPLRESVEPEQQEAYQAPEALYFYTKEQFDEAVGKDFIKHANHITLKGKRFLVGLSHGRSPSGAYQYILEHYSEIQKPKLIRYTFVNTPMKKQRDLKGVMDATAFLKKLFRLRLIKKEQILGTTVQRDDLEAYAREFNQMLGDHLKKSRKHGMDYVFLASNPLGRVAAISRNSIAFGSTEIAVIVDDKGEKEVTTTPYFLKRSQRIAFLATKADKRRSLAWLYYHWGKPDESPSFLRFMEHVKERMTVFIDDQALTWPQIEITRETPYGPSIIRIDVANRYKEDSKRKLPVILLIHGFLGLNSYDGLLTAIPANKYIAAAVHYGSVPHDLPVEEYSQHIVNNIDAVVTYFGSRGHPVYLFDHSMGNIYFLMMDREYKELKGIKKYLRGRIGANPFFGREAKHALIGFMDNVLIPSLSYLTSTAEKTMFVALRTIIPFDTKDGVRKRGISLTDWLIGKDTALRDNVWKAVKERILYLMSSMDSIPHVNRIPLERALNKLPAKLFAIQVHSALIESKTFDAQKSLLNMKRHRVPVLILKSEKDIVAKYVPGIYEGSHAEIIDVTNHEEKNVFREHLYPLVDPLHTSKIIDEFITRKEISRNLLKNQT